ncbi:hypothetical protein ACMFMF_007064 [Clarireedia jacksonii]
MGPIYNQTCGYYINDTNGSDNEASELPEVYGGVTLSDMSPLSSYNVIDTTYAISKLIDDIVDTEQTLFMDIHGDLISQTFLVDIYRLGEQAFTTYGKLNPSKTLESILTSSLIKKVFFDIRRGPNALFNQFKIEVKNVRDVQLMEYHTRDFNATHLMGLWQCFTYDIAQSEPERRFRKQVRDRGRCLFAPNHGGRPVIFNQRPLNIDLIIYMIQEVEVLFLLYRCYRLKLTDWINRLVEADAERKIMASPSAQYRPYIN